MTDTRPTNCRFRLMDENKAFPKSSCEGCGLGIFSMGKECSRGKVIADNFADHPVSLAEVRAEKEQNGSLWTPRDALIDMLRRIDSGQIKPEHICIVYRHIDGDGDAVVSYNIAGPLPRIGTVGMLEWAKSTLIIERLP